jgi:hypothetical protein
MRNSLLLSFTLLAGCSSSSPPSAPAPAAKPTVGIAVVFETQHLWLGNDSWWDKNPAVKTEGVWKPMHDALDRLGKVDLPGAQVALVGYGNGGHTVWAGPLAQLTSARLGDQASLTAEKNDDGTLRAEVGMDVSAGLDRAIVELAQMKVDKKRVILVGDGLDSDKLLASRDAFAKAGIEASAIYIQAPSGDLPGDPNGWKKLTDDVKALENGDHLADTLAATASR